MNNWRDKLFVTLQYLIPQHGLSRLVGMLARSEVPWIKTTFISLFMKRFGIDLSEAQIEDPDRFETFNAFFTRALKPDARPLEASDAADIACPADGAVSQLGAIRANQVFQAKGHDYSLYDLLGGDSALASEFTNGQFATIYLSPRDYHRVHMPVTGTLRETRYVPGDLFSVNEATANGVPNLFARNERLVCIFDTEHGPAAVILVGAMIVAGIETVFSGQVTPLPKQVVTTDYQRTAPITLEKGDELGRFLLGSTVVLLFPEGKARFEPDLKAGSLVRVKGKLGQYNQDNPA
ncbi:phosphatidylserine decarboxylase [Alcanivorax sp. HI0033]|uniref:archaetidylserine decarboxylase n=1 Tax=unclassified Alcanivorax TaxID=2638842 RepID=UPI0007B8ED2E|nr:MULTISPECIES: archaetidylserine decarboxylase [unclassified Alcanivorax]KZX77395.1 phosphatidylserine decarboxylase [Alcanivorax sp. HI0013]KZX79666.1 phosphatidylserine decarboxylase [Alcanivorax sp. HI0011]KZY27775.1 phosphatidylserine decarboxylase [Alcanivorax sp. HI0035]KZX65914.1 phosphatidylserine decarboxylase [Alcanivorax sp. HI0007]KZX70266.1 phosphatidylserine decarboxylase [Alcanivorax sp. HI0003]